MTNFNSQTNNLLLDFDSLSPPGISLSPAQVDRAIELSRNLADGSRQWQTYLNALALLGFETWVSRRDSSLLINADNCSVQQPKYTSFIDGVFNLEVGEFKVCLVTNGVLVDEVITIDRAVIDLPEYTAHFYVLVNVVEEQQEVNIDRFITYNELIQHQENTNLTADADWTYEFPSAWFNRETDDLLLYLRCLEPTAITLPSTNPLNTDIQSSLESLLPQLQSTQSLQEVLTWEQAAEVFRNPNLLTWLYELKTTNTSPANAIENLRSSLNESVSNITQTVINVKAWLSDELDRVAQNLAWTLLPAPALATTGLRDLEVVNRESPAEEFASIITQLRNSGEDIPVDARGACQDFNLATYALRLFAVTWEISETEDVPEWSLLLVLGANTNSYLPQGLKLQVCEGETILDEKVVAEDTNDSYIYTQVIGELDEQFTVKIILADGDREASRRHRIIFPNFVFE